MRKEGRKSSRDGKKEKKRKGEIRQAESKIPQEFFFPMCLLEYIKKVLPFQSNISRMHYLHLTPTTPSLLSMH